jgi:hypothetical protein
MALSEDEQRVLDEMEIALRQDDPEFVASVSIDRIRRRRRTAVAVGFVIGAIVLIGGLVATAGTVLIGVVISVIGLLMMVVAGIAALRWHRPS